MAITLADFNKIWASTSPLTPYSFSESNYKQGWNFIGSTPPARQMWDYLQKYNDEKMQYLANNYLPLSGGTMTGKIRNNSVAFVDRINNTGELLMFSGPESSSTPCIVLRGKEKSSDAGSLYVRVQDTINSKVLLANPDGAFTWNGKEVERVNSVGTNYIRYENGIQICWRSGAAFDTNDTPITLPVPFKDANYAVTVTGKGVSTSTNVSLPKIIAKTTTDFTIKGTNTNGVTTFASGTVDYIAVGWWK